MYFGFDTEDETAGAAALLVYAVYRSRNKRRGPSGLDMWGQIERFARASAKRADTVGDFLASFKRKMACDTINPYWCKTNMFRPNEYGEVIIRANQRDFMSGIVEADIEYQRDIVRMIYEQTQRIILLVRDRLEREKPIEADLVKEEIDG